MTKSIGEFQKYSDLDMSRPTSSRLSSYIADLCAPIIHELPKNLHRQFDSIAIPLRERVTWIHNHQEAYRFMRPDP